MPRTTRPVKVVLHQRPGFVWPATGGTDAGERRASSASGSQLSDLAPVPRIDPHPATQPVPQPVRDGATSGLRVRQLQPPHRLDEVPGRPADVTVAASELEEVPARVVGAPRF